MKSSPIVRDLDPFVVSLEERLSHHLWSISTLLGMSKDDIIAEALEDWIECVAPVRLETAINSQNEKKWPNMSLNMKLQ